MQLRETRRLPVPLVDAWDALNDLALLQAAIPGCESLAQTGADTFDATMALPVGPLTSRFTARLRRADIDAPNGCTLHFEASTLAASGAGRAAMRLKADGETDTTLDIDIDVRIDGAMAQFGGPLVDIAAQRIASEFFARFVAALEERRARIAT
jgi:carbon monoxide dehydrogenase subunit G